MSSTKQNTIYNVAYRVFSVLLPLVTAPYVSRVAGTEGVGLYSYAWTVSYVFCLVGMLGLNDYGVRVIAQAREDRDTLNRTFSAVWRMQLLVAASVLALWLVYVFVIAGEERQIALHLTMMSVSCLVNVDWCLMGLDRFKPIALRNTAVKLIAAAAVFLFVKGPGDLWIYGLAWSAATLAGCLLCWPSLRDRVSLVPVNWKEALIHLKPCAVLSVSVLAVSIYRQMDKVMLGRMAGMDQNGLYENAEKIIYCLSGFISAIGTVMMPGAASRVKKRDFDGVKGRMTHTMELILCMTCAMAFGLLAVADRFAPLFYGADFTASGPLLAALGFTLVMIGFANVIRTQWVLPNSRDDLFVKSVLCGAGVNLTVNLLLIPPLGALGAVIGTLSAEFTVPLVQYLLLRKELPYRTYFRLLAEYLLLGGAMAAAVRLAGRLIPAGGWGGLAALTALGAAVYGALCLTLWKAGKRTHMLKLLRR